VLVVRNGAVSLHPAFAAVLPYRELMEALIDHAFALVGDFANLFTFAVTDPQRFARHARVFQLFDYGRCLHATPDNLRHTAAWMRLTTALTRHEARACLELYDMSRHQRLLDVGGNSGEFALQACRRHASLQAVVVDLPVVCDLGLEHVLGHAEASRIGFLALDARASALPAGFDLVSFKSMLHDWPADEAKRFLTKAVDALAPGGSLLIFERGPIDVRAAPPAFSLLPILMFFRSYRSPGLYVNTLRALGMQDVVCRHLQLDTPFFLISARKP
jgi:SAM-dependent methyltransferase